jgi:hypothetical protein
MSRSYPSGLRSCVPWIVRLPLAILRVTDFLELREIR